MRSLSACLGFQLASLLCLAVTGCSLSTTAAPTADPGLAIQGKVMGGQNPITGANVYLLAANTTGYGGPGIAASSSNASVSLLTSAVLTNNPLNSGMDSNGNYYVTTGAGGSFSITSDYSCTPNTQVYLYATGGNPGLAPGTNNTAIGLLAALGNCPSAGNFLTATPYVVINEVSTIATAYAFAGFATDATHVSSSGTALAQIGIQNAFANAANLETLSTGVALATTPAGNGTVPQSTINTLANILASCINTTGTVTGPTACYTILTNALSAGTTGTQPTDTATAAINIAHNPASNIASLYGLATGTPPFAPALTAQPNDFTILLAFTGGGINNFWNGIAIDGLGNAWIGNSDSVTELSSTGAFLSGANGYTAVIDVGGEVSLTPGNYGIAIDGSDNVWITDWQYPVVVKFSSSGAVLSGTKGYPSGQNLDLASGIAIDGLGNAWVAAWHQNNIVTKLSNSGALLSGASGYSGGGLNDSTKVAIDGSGNVWITNYGAGDGTSNSVTEISNSGTFLSGANGYTGAGLTAPLAVAIDNSGNAWVANNNNLVTKLSSSGVIFSKGGGSAGGFNDIAIDGAGNAWITATNGVGYGIINMSSTGAILSGANGYTGNGANETFLIAMDGSGDAWVTTTNSSQVSGVSEFIGVATPVITPICAGLPATPTSDGSSKLGTRP